MNLQDEVLAVIRKAKDSDEYFNPYLIQGILDTISDIYGEDYVKEFEDFSQSMIDR